MNRKRFLNHANPPTTIENSMQELGLGIKFLSKEGVGMLAPMWLVFSSDSGRPQGPHAVLGGAMLQQLLNPNHFASFFFG